MGVALVSDLSDKIVRYGIPRGFIPGIVKGGPLDRVQQRRTRHAAFLKKVLFAEEIFEFGDVAVFGAVAADPADLSTVMVEDEDGGDAAACAQFAAEFFVVAPL